VVIESARTVTKFSHAYPTLLQTSCGSLERFTTPSFNNPITELGHTLYLTMCNLSLITCQYKGSITLFLIVVAVVTIELGSEVTLNLITNEDVTFLHEEIRVNVTVTKTIEETKDASIFQTELRNVFDVVHGGIIH
jgi:hypothetical protein